MKPNEITTDRLRLAPIRKTDRKVLLALLENSAVNKTYMVPDLQTQADRNVLFERFYAFSHSERFVYGIYRANRLIGLIHEVDKWDDGMELGYVIDPAEQNHGYATEALQAAISTLFSKGYRVVRAGAFAENAASIRVMEKCGMRRTGVTEAIEYRGRTHTCIFLEIEIEL